MEVFFTYEVANLFYFSAKKKVNQNIEGFLSYLARGTLTCERALTSQIALPLMRLLLLIM